MKIQSITMSNFQCFGEKATTIELDDLTCFVGPNASGKTAAMLALARLFSESKSLRRITPDDFHLAPGKRLSDEPSRNLFIECRLSFPEMDAAEGAEEQELPDLSFEEDLAIPETFNQMLIDRPGGTPYCRIRLEATWTDDGTPHGEVDEALFWVVTESEEPQDIEKQSKRVSPRDRGKIRVIYVPAARNPDEQIRATSSSTFGRLLDVLAWEGVDEEIKEVLVDLQQKLSSLEGIQTINASVQSVWQDIYEGIIARNVEFQALEREPSSLLKLLDATFSPKHGETFLATSDLSDGMRSLFSLTLALGFYMVEEQLKKDAVTSGFKLEIVERLPVYTLFAVEEPENHLSPHYLGRIIGALSKTATETGAQVVISSHSPAILGRIEPEKVRYFLGNEKTSSSKVKRIPLPSKSKDEEYKYVREAVRGYPELYFSRLVILGEGPSEEIVLKKLFEASGTPLDTHFISIVPLGGRHVHHFWRLLHGLRIPFLTLLDLDREKHGGGWGRIQYVRNQLVKRFSNESSELVFTEGKTERSLAEEEFNTLAEQSDSDKAEMQTWLELFRDGFNVFFSAPLDLDFSMLAAFPRDYKGLASKSGGPRLPQSGEEQIREAIGQRMRQVLGANTDGVAENSGSSYTEDERKLFPWYRYLFLDGSKPVNHMRALVRIPSYRLVKDAPESLRLLVEKAREILKAAEESD